MLMKSSFLLFAAACLLFTSEKTFAQTDYVVMSNGDTLRGSIKISDPSKIKFDSQVDKKKLKFKPEELIGFYTVKKGTFKSLYIPDRKGTFFLQLIEGDKIKLYEFFDKKFSPFPNNGFNGGFGVATGGLSIGFSKNELKYWYAQKTDSLINIKTNQLWWGDKKKRIDNLYDMIKDNPTIAEKYKTEDKFSFKFIRALIKEYNSAQ